MKRLITLLALIMTTVTLGDLTSAYAQGSGKEEKKKVLTPQNVDPNIDYNLPPNFDPNFRPKRTPRNIKVTIDFRKAQLEEVVKFFSGAMKKNFIISDSINTSKTITIISPREVTIAEAYRAFLAALQMNGLTIVPMGAFSKIVESKSAIVEPQDAYEVGERIPNEARMVTAIIPVENASVDEIQSIIQKFVTPEATIIPYGSSLIITENGSNLRRIQRLVEKLDKGDSANKVYVYKVLHADATEVATKLEEIFAAKGGGKSSSKAKKGAKKSEGDGDIQISDIIADDRTNQLIIVSNRKSFEKIREMIEILDVPTEVGGQIHVRPLEYADADELASTLSSLAQGANRNTPRASSRASRSSSSNRSSAPSGPSVASLLEGDVQITAYKPTNSLIVVAAPRDFVALENVINTLDRPQRQVYVEAVIMEIGLDTNTQLGLGFNAGVGQDFDAVIPDSAVEQGLVSDTRGLMVGQSNYNGIDSAVAGAGGALGLLGPLIQIPGTSISLPAFALLLKATQTDNSVNILSTPTILTMDNEEAEIKVGERVPFLQGLSSSAGAGLASALGASSGAASAVAGLSGFAGLTSPIQYEDVGITLRITPQVNESGYVRLEVDQEVSDIKGAGGLGAGAPITTQRNVKTVVLVKDQSTVVIGGLLREIENDTIEKVPFLGDIPLLGFLFRNTVTITTKQNLILMLTPYVIESESDLQKIRKRKLEEREELLKMFGRRDLAYIKTVNFQKKSGLLDRMRSNIGGALGEQRARQEALEAFKSDDPQYRTLGAEEEAEVNPDDAKDE